MNIPLASASSLKPDIFNGFIAFLLFGLPVIFGLILGRRAARERKRHMALIWPTCGLLPLLYLFILMTGIQMRWWGE